MTHCLKHFFVIRSIAIMISNTSWKISLSSRLHDIYRTISIHIAVKRHVYNNFYYSCFNHITSYFIQITSLFIHQTLKNPNHNKFFLSEPLTPLKILVYHPNMAIIHQSLQVKYMLEYHLQPQCQM